MVSGPGPALLETEALAHVELHPSDVKWAVHKEIIYSRMGGVTRGFPFMPLIL
jgi:hypothetical protein